MWKSLTAIVLSGCFALCSGVVAAADPALDLEAERGKVVYVDFWASWCVPCKKSFPWMEQMHQKYADKGLKIIAVNLDENPADADRFLQKYPVSFEIVRDPEGQLAEHYRIQGMPTALLFDPDGKLVKRHIGFRDSEKAAHETAISALLPAKEVKR